MALKKRNAIWHTDFQVNGQRIRQSLGTTDKRQALSLEKQLISRACEGKLSQTANSLARQHFDFAADDYVAARHLELAPNSRAKERQLLKKLRIYFKAEPLKAITAKRITDYRTWRAAQKVGPATMNAELGILRRILQRAKLWSSVADGIKPLKEPKTIGRALSPEERSRLLMTAQLKPEWETAYLAAILCLNTTARGCELKGLQWMDIDRTGTEVITIKRSKTLAGQRLIPINFEAGEALGRLRDRAETFGRVEPSHYVFGAFVPKFTFSGKRVVGYDVTSFDPSIPIKSWRTAWRSLTKQAGLLGFRFHDLRHTAITDLVEAGAADSIVMSIAGHIDKKMLERYSHVRMDAKRQAMKALSTPAELRAQAQPMTQSCLSEISAEPESISENTDIAGNTNRTAGALLVHTGGC